MLAETIGVIGALIILAISVCLPVKVCNIYPEEDCNSYCPGPEECIQREKPARVPTCAEQRTAAGAVQEREVAPIIKQHNNTQTARPSVDTGTDPMGKNEAFQFPSVPSMRKSVSYSMEQPLLRPRGSRVSLRRSSSRSRMASPRRASRSPGHRPSRVSLGRKPSRVDARRSSYRPSRAPPRPSARPSRAGLGARPSRAGLGARPSRAGLGARPSRAGLGARPSRAGLGARPSRAGLGARPSRAGLGGRPSRRSMANRPSRVDDRRPSRPGEVARRTMH